MPLNSLGSEILTISGVTDGATTAAIVGDTLNFQPAQTFAAATVLLPTKPSGSSASVSTTSVTFDVPGRFVVTVAAGGFTRTVVVVAFPASVLTLKIGQANASSSTVTRTALQMLIQDPRVTPATITAALEIAVPQVGNILGANQPLYWSNYAPG